MSEGALWQTVRKHLAPFGLLRRIEDCLAAGLPDVVYLLRPGPVGNAVGGWIELKQVRAWPVRPKTPIRVPPHTAAQASFMVAWQAAGGNAYMILQVGRDYLLLGPPAATALAAGKLCTAGLRAAATAHGAGEFPAMLFLKHLLNRA